MILLRLLMVVALWSVASLAEDSGLEVYAGFMDEELKDVLGGILRDNPDRQVIVVEREIRNPGMLFELPIVRYGQTPRRESVRQLPAGSSFQARLAANIRTQLTRDAEALAQAKDPGMKAKTAVGSEDFQIVTFNPQASSRKPPLVILRSPEMGLQPALTTQYLSTFHTALAKMDEAAPRRGGINYSVFGTSGAVGSHLAPGELNRVNGSIYVGVELVPTAAPGGKPKYRGVIQTIDNKGNAPQTFFRSVEFDSREAAEGAAKVTFNSPTVLNLSGPLEESAGNRKTSLSARLRQIQGSNGGSISLTVSFFGGEKEKETGRRLGLTTVNMEDFHVFSALTALTGHRQLGTVNVTRFNCDPPEIPEHVVDSMVKWGERQKYTGDHYADAILWGLKGAVSSEVPATGHWGALQENPDADRYAYRMPGKGDAPGAILDPFYSEIATDFLTAAQKGEALTPEIFSKVFYDRLSEEDRQRLNDLLAAKNRKLSQLAKEIATRFTEKLTASGIPPQEEAEIRQKILALMAEAATLDIPRESPLFDKMVAATQDSPSKQKFLTGTGRIRLLAAESDDRDGSPSERPLEVWVRTGKWKANTSTTLDHLLSELYKKELAHLSGPERAKKFQELIFGGYFDREGREEGKTPGKTLDGANADRALYKTGLVGGMLRASWDHVRKRAHFFRLLSDPAYFEKEFKRVREKLNTLDRDLRCAG